MNAGDAVGLAVSLVLIAYLLFALLRGDRL
jgi:K+-transporting ATPase KdpF subunit